METLLTKVSFVTSISLQLFVLGALIRRRLRKRFPWFLTYIIYEICATGLRSATSTNEALYYRVYYLTAIGGLTLAILSVRESFMNVFREYQRSRWFSSVVWGAVAAALAYALLKAWILPPVGATHLGTAIIALEAAVDYSLTAVGILYLAFALFFGIKEHQWETGIISGFTINTGLAVFGLLLVSAFGMKFRILNEWIPAVAYILGEVEWVVALARPERKVKEPIRNLHIDDPGKMDQYMKILRRFFGRGA